MKDHLDWIDEHNFGVSHFGFHPNDLPRHLLRFDVFHCRCAVTRRMMSTLKNFILKQSTAMIDSFCNVLHKFWGEFHVTTWKEAKYFSSFQGSELLLFIKNTNLIINFLNDNFQNTATLSNLCESLLLWENISPFLLITDIEDVELYKIELASFINNVKQFYKVGAKSFLTKDKGNPGGNETFYMHTLRFYLPKLATFTLENDSYGLGIFTMQGYERRNKE